MPLPSSNSFAPYRQSYDLANCDEEPLRFIRHFQKPGKLLAVDKTSFTIKACAGDFSMLYPAGEGRVIGMNLADLLPPASLEEIIASLGKQSSLSGLPIKFQSPSVTGGQDNWNIIARATKDLYLLEFEPRDESVSSSDFLLRMDLALQHVQDGGEMASLADRVVEEVKALTNYDRVMLYRFDADNNGEVIAEAREPELPAFLHLHYPHTDIPKQARELFLKNPVRQIASTDKDQVSIVITDENVTSLDLSCATGRGSSPIHLEYLRNMGVGASLSIAIVVEQRLWGLIACHHRTEKVIDYRLRTMLNLLGKTLSGHLGLWEAVKIREDLIGVNLTRSRLYERMSQQHDIVDGLFSEGNSDLLHLMNAAGVALLLEEEVHTQGDCPSQEEVKKIIAWLEEKEQHLYVTNQLYNDFPPVKNFRSRPAGLLSIRISYTPGEYLVWFRPEEVSTINWGGNPNQRKEVVEGKVRLHPNLSFAQWQEEKKGVAKPWESYHLDAGFALRNDIKEVLLQKYYSVKKTNSELVEAYEELESYSYMVSHDLRAPLRRIKTFAEILREDYHANFDDFGKTALESIVTGVGKMNTLINDILSFSKVGQQEVISSPVSIADLVEETWEILRDANGNVETDFRLDPVTITGDYQQLKQVVLNLLSNAVKYSRDVPQPKIEVEWKKGVTEFVFRVKDNGIGMNMKHADRIFSVFQRLVTDDAYEGTGVGLAIVKRVVDKHNGTINVRSALGKGAEFIITFPTQTSPQVDSPPEE